MLVEGVRAAGEALDAGVEVVFAVASPRLSGGEAGRKLAERLASHELAEVDDRELARLSDTEQHQGALLVCREPAADLGAVEAGGRWLVLDRVQDPGNAGTLVRAAVAFALDGVLCLQGTVDPWSTKTVRASAGGVFRLPVIRAEAEEAATRLADVGIPLLVADTGGEEVGGAEQGAFALVVGNEGGGVRPELIERAARSVGVRMRGPAESLNVAMAAAILLHDLTRKAGSA